MNRKPVVTMRIARWGKAVSAAAITGALVLGAAPVSQAAPTATATTVSTVPAAAPAALAGWKKTLLSKDQVARVVALNPTTMQLVDTYNEPDGYAKTWVGMTTNGARAGAAVEIDRIDPSQWKTATKNFATTFGFTVDTSTGTYFTAHKDDGTSLSHVYMKNQGNGYVFIGLYATPSGDTTGVGPAKAKALALAQATKTMNAFTR